MVEVEPIDLKQSHTMIVAGISALVTLVPLLNTAFGLHILIPTDPQQAAMVTLIELTIAFLGYIYVMYRRTYAVSGPTKSAVAKMQAKAVESALEPPK